MTSANVTYYKIYDLDNVCVGKHSQHCLCKSTVKEELQKYQPANKYKLQINHPDENEADHYSKMMNLQDYLDGKYKHTAWQEEDGNIDDSHYCAEHHYQYLKEKCPECAVYKIKTAKDLIIKYGGIDGPHHKAWVLDQIFRVLCAEKYDEEVAKACNGENGPDTYSWDEGIAP